MVLSKVRERIRKKYECCANTAYNGDDDGSGIELNRCLTSATFIFF